MLRRCSLALLVSLLAAIDARAQERFVVRGIGFGTFGRLETRTTRVFGAGVGLSVNEMVQLTIEAAQEWGRADPRQPARLTTADPAPPGSITLIVLGVESVRQDRRLTGGVRFRAPARYRLEPFAVVNAGIARVTDRYLPNSLGVEGSTSIELLTEVGGGLSLALTDRLKLESSYRVGRIGGNHPFTVQAFGGGLAVGF